MPKRTSNFLDRKPLTIERLTTQLLNCRAVLSRRNFSEGASLARRRNASTSQLLVQRFSFCFRSRGPVVRWSRGPRVSAPLSAIGRSALDVRRWAFRLRSSRAFPVKTRPPWFYKQAGVIPYRRVGPDLKILLVTTKYRGRWIIPKGIVDPGETPIESACKEAYEEAGVKGRADLQMIGEYDYKKWGGTCTVQVFGLEVTTVLESWPEAYVRQRKWLGKEEAADSVKEPGLKEIIRKFLVP